MLIPAPDAPEAQPYDREIIAAVFDRRAGEAPADGARKPRGIDSIVRREALRLLKLTSRDTFLDLGTGLGRVLHEVAPHIRLGYGIDISRVSLDVARRRAADNGLHNLLFGLGAIEEPSQEINLAAAGANKMLLLWSLHHLPDELKASALAGLVKILRRPGRIVIGDLIFFEPPLKHKPLWDRVHYDGGMTDRPSTAPFLADTLAQLGGKVKVSRLHPLAGVVLGEFE
jgi:SAM-dependent methyltransferase